MIQIMCDAVAEILRIPGDLLRTALTAIPLQLARILLLALPTGLLVCVLFMDRSRLCGRLHERGHPINLRPYIVAVLLIQVLIYAFL